MVRACDELGMYMMDETWDMWVTPKLAYDYSSEFEKFYESDIEAIIRRDYNYPSIIIYSIGNEVTDPHNEKGIQLEKNLIEIFPQNDSTRPVTLGYNIQIAVMATKEQSFFGEDGPDSQEKGEGKRPPLN